jgi:hypothetical protein
MMLFCPLVRASVSVPIGVLVPSGQHKGLITSAQPGTRSLQRRLETREPLKVAPHTLLSYQGSIRPG